MPGWQWAKALTQKYADSFPGANFLEHSGIKVGRPAMPCQIFVGHISTHYCGPMAGICRFYFKETYHNAFHII